MVGQILIGRKVAQKSAPDWTKQNQIHRTDSHRMDRPNHLIEIKYLIKNNNLIIPKDWNIKIEHTVIHGESYIA